jgi:hypothetical protein
MVRHWRSGSRSASSSDGSSDLRNDLDGANSLLGVTSRQQPRLVLMIRTVVTEVSRQRQVDITGGVLSEAARPEPTCSRGHPSGGGVTGRPGPSSN